MPFGSFSKNRLSPAECFTLRDVQNLQAVMFHPWHPSHYTLTNTSHGSGWHGLLEDYFPLQTVGFPLPCDVLVGV